LPEREEREGFRQPFKKRRGKRRRRRTLGSLSFRTSCGTVSWPEEVFVQR
jgi:hypothetical protein